MSNIYYYGCLNGVGHHLFNFNLKVITGLEEKSLYFKLGVIHIDWDIRIRPKIVKSGKTKITYLNSYTVLSFYDCNNSRHNSHSTYILTGIFKFDRAFSLSREAFPTIFSRYTFPIELEGDDAMVAPGHVFNDRINRGLNQRDAGPNLNKRVVGPDVKATNRAEVLV